MIIDTSVVIAILLEEPGYEAYLEVITGESNLRISAANYLEAAIVSRTYRRDHLLDELLAQMGVAVVSMTAEDAQFARDAHARYGRGSGSPAKLNFGDCIAYGLSARMREPLLFKGEDFAHTDVRRVSHLA